MIQAGYIPPVSHQNAHFKKRVKYLNMSKNSWNRVEAFQPSPKIIYSFYSKNSLIFDCHCFWLFPMYVGEFTHTKVIITTAMILSPDKYIRQYVSVIQVNLILIECEEFAMILVNNVGK